MSGATLDIDWTRYAVPVGDGVVETSRALSRDGEEFAFIASTGGEASDGDIIDQDSWRLAQYRTNPVVLYEHTNPVIGTARVSQGKPGDDLHAWITFDDADANPVGKLAKHQHAAGIRSAVSVRWRPGKMTPRNKLDKAHPAYAEAKEVDTWWGGKVEVVGQFHQQNTLIEVSSVALPADPRALQIRGAHGMTGEQIRSALAGNGRPASIRDDIMDLLRSDPEIRATLRVLLAVAPPPPDSRQSAALAAIRELHTAFFERTTP